MTQRIIGDSLTAEINEKQARSIKYQLTIAKLPLAKDLDDFQFEGTPINETLVRDLAGGGFLAQHLRNPYISVLTCKMTLNEPDGSDLSRRSNSAVLR